MGTKRGGVGGGEGGNWIVMFFVIIFIKGSV